MRSLSLAGAMLATAGCGSIVGLSPKAPPAVAASDRALGFSLTSQRNETVDLATTLAANDVVLVFYRGHW